MKGCVWDNKELCHTGIRNSAISTMPYKWCVRRFTVETINLTGRNRKHSLFLTFGWSCSGGAGDLYLESCLESSLHRKTLNRDEALFLKGVAFRYFQMWIKSVLNCTLVWSVTTFTQLRLQLIQQQQDKGRSCLPHGFSGNLKPRSYCSKTHKLIYVVDTS